MEEVLERVSLENPLRKLVQDKALVYHSTMSPEEFDRFVLENGDLRIERDKHGTIIIHPPMCFDSAFNKGRAFNLLSNWGYAHFELGYLLSPSGSFYLLDGSQHKADGAWVSRKRAIRMPEGERKKIPH
ncbi:MAG: Uma2 family endonuclease, partial [Bacteroidota bacterium]